MQNNNRNVPKIENIELSNFDFMVKAAAHYISEFCENMKIDNVSGLTENVFSACLKYFYNHFLRMDLYTKTKQTSNKQSIINYNDSEELENILSVYLYICDCYNKIPSLYSFYCFSGITQQILESWTAADTININASSNSSLDDSDIYNSIDNNNINTNYKSQPDGAKLIRTRSNIYKTLVSRRESALSQRLESGGGGVGTIAVLNHCYGWNDTQNTINLSLQVPTISANNLPLLPPNRSNDPQ